MFHFLKKLALMISVIINKFFYLIKILNYKYLKILFNINLYDLDDFILNENDNINISPIFDDENGIYKDIILIQINKSESIDPKKLKEKNSYFLNVPFFEKVNINDICFYK